MGTQPAFLHATISAAIASMEGEGRILKGWGARTLAFKLGIGVGDTSGLNCGENFACDLKKSDNHVTNGVYLAAP